MPRVLAGETVRAADALPVNVLHRVALTSAERTSGCRKRTRVSTMDSSPASAAGSSAYGSPTNVRSAALTGASRSTSEAASSTRARPDQREYRKAEGQPQRAHQAAARSWRRERIRAHALLPDWFDEQQLRSLGCDWIPASRKWRQSE